ncbi:poly-beta-1,6-N-acetyl-D-glucosamine N-deacetylase PgaB [Aquirhabdus sp.]|uniref:poly-beta-1,6-N-acetyl-D-glucosamine N-deacetylase PgaB n=1 Tax=Aquirhabdus sp. TaxID=2824160 RepID=UPI00396C5CB5
MRILHNKRLWQWLLYLSAIGLYTVCGFGLVQAQSDNAIAGTADHTVQIPQDQYVVLAFHDVRENFRPSVDRDPYAIDAGRLAHFFDWIQSHHLQPVSLQQILDAQQNKQALPKNAVLLTFDDGPESHFKTVYPLLKTYNYPALFALQTGWITGQVPSTAYGPNGFVTWAQLREMQASGLVEFATHTHDLHRGIMANPQGNLEPAAMTRLYDPATQRYESDADYRLRIRNDLTLSAYLIQKELGIRPRAVVWPYGAMSELTREIAASAGLPISFALGDDRINQVQDIKVPLSRLLVSNNPNAVQIEQQIDDVLLRRPVIQRAVQVDLDDVYDADPALMEVHLGKLLDRIKALNVGTVYLKAFHDQDNSGVASALYFPNRHLPMRADLLNRVAWQLRTRSGVNVYAWLPLLAFQLPDSAQQQRLEVHSAKGSALSHRSRLSPFLPETVQLVGDVYEDLGINASSLNGLLIGENAQLAVADDDRRCNIEARMPKTDQPLVNCQQLPAANKTMALMNFGDLAVARFSRYRDSSNRFRVARKIDARVVLNPALESQFAQSLPAFLAHYDEVVLVTLPRTEEGVALVPQRLTALVTAVAKIPQALDKVTFELPAKDGRSKEWVSNQKLQKQMQMLAQFGVRNLAYYPDDFLHNLPHFDALFGGMSLNQFPAFYKDPQVGAVADPKQKGVSP